MQIYQKNIVNLRHNIIVYHSPIYELKEKLKPVRISHALLVSSRARGYNYSNSCRAIGVGANI